MKISTDGIREQDVFAVQVHRSTDRMLFLISDTNGIAEKICAKRHT